MTNNVKSKTDVLAVLKKVKNELDAAIAHLEHTRAQEVELGRPTPAEESCLVCGNLFDAGRQPVLECRGVRVCSICRSRCSNVAIEFQKQTEGRLNNSTSANRNLTDSIFESERLSGTTSDYYKLFHIIKNLADKARAILEAQ